MSPIQTGDRVSVHYTARFADGTLFATSLPGDPLAFTAAGGEVIAGLSRAVVGMHVGETKRVTVAPEEGFGRRDPALERRVPRDSVPAEVAVGDQLSAEADGVAMAVWVRDVGSEFAVVDGNHPLAGQTLIFEFEVLACLPSDRRVPEDVRASRSAGLS